MNSQRILTYLIAVLALGSCESVIDIDLPVEPTRLVVNGFINPDSAVAVRISKSKFVLDRSNSFSLVDDAQVTLFENGQEVTQLTTESRGWYTASFRPQPGQQYSIQASAGGLETIEASTEVASKVTINALEADSVLRQSGTSCVNGDCQPNYSTNYRIQLNLSDPADQENFYEIMGYLVVEDSFPTFSSSGDFIGYEFREERQDAYFDSEDPVVSDSELFFDGGFYGSSMLFTDEVFSGRNYTVDFTLNGPWGGSIKQFTILLRSLSNDQYQYIRSLQLQEFNEGDPFSEVVPVYNNIENGFGIFAGYSADSVVVKTY